MFYCIQIVSLSIASPQKESYLNMFSAIMAKKSYKQHSKSEKIQVGCMSGLIRMLDFRRSPKLLSDGRGESIQQHSVLT